jgi:hypothetical protein
MNALELTLSVLVPDNANRKLALGVQQRFGLFAPWARRFRP